MPKFRVYLERDYTVSEGSDVEIDADDLEAAYLAADALRIEWDEDVPDDISETGGGHSGAFSVARVLPVGEPTSAPMPMTKERALSVSQDSNYDYAKWMSQNEIHAVREYWLAQNDGRLSFNDIVRRCAT